MAITAGGPGQAWSEGGEYVEECPGQDDVVVGTDVEGQEAHAVPDTYNRNSTVQKRVERFRPYNISLDLQHSRLQYSTKL